MTLLLKRTKAFNRLGVVIYPLFVDAFSIFRRIFMNNTQREVIQFINDNDVKFIRLAFCDIFGIQKNISIMPDELERAFSEGISFDASAIAGFLNVEASDLFLYPDPTTLSLLPWRPQNGRVVRFFCEIRDADGNVFESDARAGLRNICHEAQKEGFMIMAGMECEFYLFKQDEWGNPTDIPLDKATYFDIAPADAGENVRREICLTLEKMGIQPESSHHEHGPGQNEIDFRYDDAFTSCDNLITFKSVVETIASLNGLYASFDPKPLADEAGNGLHINLSVYDETSNLFADQKSEMMASFTAGILRRIKEITLFLNPVKSSYQRLGKFEAPKYISWSHQNRSQLIRIPAARGEYRRIEVRSADPMCNPYLALSLLLSAGLEGVHDKLTLNDPVNENLYEKEHNELERLPLSLKEAIEKALQSEFVNRVLPKHLVDKYIEVKEKEMTE